MAAAAAARAVMEDGGGSYPFPSNRSSTLLPGQTYPDPLPAKLSSTMQVVVQSRLMSPNRTYFQCNLIFLANHQPRRGLDAPQSPGVLN